MKEREIENKIVNKLKSMGCIIFKIPNEYTFTYKHTNILPGIPDLICIFPNGKLIFIEVKTEKGRLSERQKKIHEILKKYKQDVYIIKSLEEAINIYNQVQMESHEVS